MTAATRQASLRSCTAPRAGCHLPSCKEGSCCHSTFGLLPKHGLNPPLRRSPLGPTNPRNRHRRGRWNQRCSWERAPTPPCTRYLHFPNPAENSKRGRRGRQNTRSKKIWRKNLRQLSLLGQPSEVATHAKRGGGDWDPNCGAIIGT